MDDLARRLPLSMRDRGDESGISGDWSPRTRGILLQLADLAEELGTEGLERPSLRADRSLRQAAEEPLAALRRGAATDHDDLPAALRSAAIALGGDRRSRGVRPLCAAVVALLEVATALDERLELDPVTTGAVAVAQAYSGPLPARLLARERTLVATDAGWSVGRGPLIEAPAAAIILGLYGRAALPQRGSAG